MPSRIQATTITDYFSQADPAAQPILETLDQLITGQLPAFTPLIKWHLPFYQAEKRYVSIAAYQAHVSLSLSVDLPAELLSAAKAAGYATGQKRLNIGLTQTVPTQLVKQLLALVA